MKLKSVVLILFTLLCIACNQQTKNRETNQYEILSLLVSDMTKPPFPIALLKERYTDEEIDSIMNTNQKVAVAPTFFHDNSEIPFNVKVNSEFKELLAKMKTDESAEEMSIDINKIRVPNNVKLVIADTAKIKQDRYYIEKNYNIWLTFLKVYFKDTQDRAIIVAGLSRGYLSGGTSVFFLEKIDGIWQKVGSQSLSIS